MRLICCWYFSFVIAASSRLLTHQLGDHGGGDEEEVDYDDGDEFRFPEAKTNL